MKINNYEIVTDKSLSEAAKDLLDLSTPGYINLDFNKIEADINAGKKIIMTSATGVGETRVREALDRILKSPVWQGNEIDNAGKLLIKILCSKECDVPITAKEISFFTEFTSKLPSSVDLKWAIGDGPSLKESVKIIAAAYYVA